MLRRTVESIKIRIRCGPVCILFAIALILAHAHSHTHTYTQWMQHTVRSFVSGQFIGIATPKTHSREDDEESKKKNWEEFNKIEQRWREVMIQHICVTGVIGRCRRLWLQKEIYLMRNAKQLCLQSIFVCVCDDEETHPRSFHRFYDKFFSFSLAISIFFCLCCCFCSFLLFLLCRFSMDSFV